MGPRTLLEPTPTEIKQFAEEIKANALQRRNSRGGRGTAENFIAALRCIYRHVDEALHQQRAAGFGDEDNQPLPAGNARDLCRQWVQAGWLVRQVSDDDVEVYRLSAYGVGALEVAGRAGGARTRVSESRVRTLLDAIERLVQNADPDVMARIARLWLATPRP